MINYVQILLLLLCSSIILCQHSLLVCQSWMQNSSGFPPLCSLNNGAYFVQVLPQGFPSLTGRWIYGYSLLLWACGATQLLCCDAFCSIILMWSFTTEKTSGHGSLAGNPKPLETRGHSPFGLSVLPMGCQILLWEIDQKKNSVRNLRE